MFREGAAQILVSAKTLVEGFDVPEADVGIVSRLLHQSDKGFKHWEGFSGNQKKQP